MKSYSPGEDQPHPTTGVLMEDRRGPGSDRAMPDAGRGRGTLPRARPGSRTSASRMGRTESCCFPPPQSVVIVTATPVGLRDHRPLLTGPITPVRSRPGDHPARTFPAPSPQGDLTAPRTPPCPNFPSRRRSSFTRSSQSHRDTRAPAGETEARDGHSWLGGGREPQADGGGTGLRHSLVRPPRGQGIVRGRKGGCAGPWLPGRREL